jgi:hypothetical protein
MYKKSFGAIFYYIDLNECNSMNIFNNKPVKK